MQLRLEIPEKHLIYANMLESASSAPVTGSLVISSHTHAESTSLGQVRIHLVRVLTEKAPKDTRQSQPLRQYFSRLIQKAPKSTQPAVAKQNSSVIESLVLHVPRLGPETQVGYCPENGRIYKIPFHMSISSNHPGTATTQLGDISYYMVASVNTANGSTLNTTTGIELSRRILHDSPLVQHTRAYPNSILIKKMTLNQDIATSMGSHIPISLEIFIPPRGPAERPTEYTCIAVRGIRWRIEEVTRIFIRSENDHQGLSEMPPKEDNVCTHETHSGFQKGYWRILPRPITAKLCPRDEEDEDWGVEIEFRINISKVGGGPAPEISLKRYDADLSSADQLSSQYCRFATTNPGMMITVEHRIKFDVLMSEDTFDAHTDNLVDRKALRTALNASFPLRIVDHAVEKADEMPDCDIPPPYTDVYIPSPEYI